ncbi:hypothetical protein A2U01_0069207, partial [Trifolium medium]|nr:hypothetical protein [Trifolium medium]
MLRRFGVSSVNCAPRRSGWRVAPVCKMDASGTLGCWRVAQLHPARRAPSKFIMCATQN